MTRVLLSLFILLFSCQSMAEDDRQSRLQSLGQDLQSLKTDMLELSTEIARMESQLYPADNRVTVFLSLPEEINLALESMQLHINGALVGTHIYDVAHNRALRSGGIQKLYEGFVASGQHSLQLVIRARQADGELVRLNSSYDFDKSAAASKLEARLLSESQQAWAIRFGEL